MYVTLNPNIRSTRCGNGPGDFTRSGEIGDDGYTKPYYRKLDSQDVFCSAGCFYLHDPSDVNKDVNQNLKGV